ncbi:hypothetical protein [Myroides odoratimimus]|uniref:hypothetical protein n=1 Tax=Myroides odoratimimus TaxID=76832 RepID=UPI0031012A34
MRVKDFLIVLVVMLFTSTSMAQEHNKNNDFPLKISGYFGLFHPIVTLQGTDITMNLEHAYTVGFVTGISFQKNVTYGYSLEIVPVIEATRHENKVKNVVIQPGVYFPLEKGWTLTNRLSFETNGRYGITPSISKVLVKRNQTISVTVPFPVRFGNNNSISVATGVLLTLSI